MAFLHERVNLVVKELERDEVAVSVLGSFADGGVAELEGYLAAWRDTNPETEVVVERGARPRILRPSFGKEGE